MPTSRSGALCAGSCGARVCCSVSGADGKAGPDARKLACAGAAGFPGSAAGAVAAVAGFSGTPAGRGAGPAENQPDTGGTGPDRGPVPEQVLQVPRAGGSPRPGRRGQCPQGLRFGPARTSRRIRNHHRLKGGQLLFLRFGQHRVPVAPARHRPRVPRRFAGRLPVPEASPAHRGDCPA